MAKRQLIQMALLAVLASSSALANATANTFHTIYGTNFGTGSTYSTQFLGDIDATFTAKSGNAAGHFAIASRDGYKGVGVQGGPSGNELGVGESINANFSKGIFITNLVLGLLYDDDYSRTKETAKITATYLDGSEHSFLFQATGEKTASITGEGSYKNISKAEWGEGGVWSISNAFGENRVTGLSFTAISNGLSNSSRCGDGSNGLSDYALISISAVPEPETYAMMLVGLGLMGFAARRNKQD